MVSHEYKCIFIHIPKCAGTSIEKALGHHDDYSGRDMQDHRSLRQIERPIVTYRALQSPENAAEVLRAFRNRFRKSPNPKNNRTVSSAQYATYFKFTFVRNPWSRAYSWYSNVMRDELHLKHYGLEPNMPFSDYLAVYAGKDMLKPQTYWIKDFSGNIGLDFIGKFEQLNEDWANVSERLGLKNLTLPHSLPGSGEVYRQHYTDSSASLVADIYAEEIALFGYAF